MTGIVERVGRVSHVGKVDRHVFDTAIQSRLGQRRPEVLVGPRHGVDAGIVDLGNEQVMALTTDPLFVMPELGWQRAAWLAVHIAASDAATSGLVPTYCTAALSLPLDMTDAELSNLWAEMHGACLGLGIAVVTGHTGRYEGCSYPILGALTVAAVGPADSYVTTDMAGPGDIILITKGAAIETTALFGTLLQAHLTVSLGPDATREAAALFFDMSVVRDARSVTQLGVRDNGVTSMHDATERGVWGGLREIAEASGNGLIVEQDAIPVLPSTRKICDLFDIDPYSASSEGTLLITCRPHKVDEATTRLESDGIRVAVIGEMTPREEGIRVALNGRERELRSPDIDPFWPALRRAMDEWGTS